MTSQSNGETYANRLYKDVTANGGVTVPNLLKVLALFPHATSIDRGHLWLRNLDERLPIRGGSWYNGVGAGVFSLGLYGARSDASAGIGFRPAFVL